MKGPLFITGSALAALLISSNAYSSTMNVPVLTTNPKAATVDNEAAKLAEDEWQRKSWDLTKEEWERYKLIIRTTNPTSRFLNLETVDPYRVLFDYAETDLEKVELSRKAMLYIRKQHLKEAEWFDLNTAVGNELFGELKDSPSAPIRFNQIGNVALEPMAKNKMSRTLFFYKVEGCDAQCAENVIDSVANAKEEQQIEVFLSKDGGKVTEKDVTDFTNKYGVTKDQVKSDTYNFHIDNGEAKGMGVTHYPTMVIMGYTGAIFATRL
ncbi:MULTISPECIES: hypothetical protein [Vibrio]|uniref:hypothetical protein n=1 Tax=Vibrio TaxID=662 RepID=UPI001E5BC06B|nr:hypothetical protein [Vibrio lentus]MCC4838033.1 hypothetical protein [Vibrio lentus]